TAPMLPTLITPRLRLTPAAERDVEALCRVWAAAEVREFLFDGATIDRARAEALVADCRSLEDAGLGLWVVRAGGSGEVAGCAALLPAGESARFEPRLEGAVEPLVALAPDCWGAGWATEALRAAFEHAFGAVGLTRLVATVDVPNAASHALVQRLGFRALSITEGPRHERVHY